VNRTAAILLALAAVGAAARETHSTSYRLIGPASSSVAARAASPVHTAYVVGGAGQAAGLAASPQASVYSGATSNALPTARVFRDGLEAP